MGTHCKDIKECLKPEHADRWDMISEQLFEKVSPLHQSGLFKLEYCCTFALYRSGKSYLIKNRLEHQGGNRMIKMRSISRKAHEHLPDEVFSQNVRENVVVVRTNTMRPLPSMEVAMIRESKTLCNTLNFRRNFGVNCFTKEFYSRKMSSLFFRIPTIRYHGAKSLDTEWKATTTTSTGGKKTNKHVTLDDDDDDDLEFY